MQRVLLYGSLLFMFLFTVSCAHKLHDDVERALVNYEDDGHEIARKIQNNGIGDDRDDGISQHSHEVPPGHYGGSVLTLSNLEDVGAEVINAMASGASAEEAVTSSMIDAILKGMSTKETAAAAVEAAVEFAAEDGMSTADLVVLVYACEKGAKTAADTTGQNQDQAMAGIKIGAKIAERGLGLPPGTLLAHAGGDTAPEGYKSPRRRSEPETCPAEPNPPRENASCTDIGTPGYEPYSHGPESYASKRLPDETEKIILRLIDQLEKRDNLINLLEKKIRFLELRQKDLTRKLIDHKEASN
jgi:hypothetical protein